MTSPNWKLLWPWLALSFLDGMLAGIVLVWMLGARP